MVLFLISLIPLALIFFHIKNRNSGMILASVLYFFSAILLCLIFVFFSSYYRVVSAGFWGNFIYYFFAQIFIPIFVLYGLFFLLSKDSLEYKINAFFPISAAFYSVFLPFSILRAEITHSFFTLFVKPVLFLCMLIALAQIIKLLFAFCKKAILQKNVKMWFIFSLLVIATISLMTTPAAIEALWYDCCNLFLWVGLSVLYLGGTFVLWLKNKLSSAVV